MEISRFYRISSIFRASDGIVFAKYCRQGGKDNLMTKKVKNDVTAGSFCVPPYHSDGKYNSTLEEKNAFLKGLLKKMPLEECGQVTEENLGIYRQTKA